MMDSPDGTQMVKLKTRPGVRIRGMGMVFGRTQECFVYENRSGYCWVAPSKSLTVLIPEVDRWLRDNIGPRHGEAFAIDRVYYPGEDRPDLPSGWQANAAFYPQEIERWTIGSSGGLRHDTVFFDTMDSAMLFHLRWSGELIEW